MESSEQKDAKKAKKPRHLLLKLLAWLFGIVLFVVLLAAGVIATALHLLTPERLTPIVENVASNYLDADVHVGRVELTYWSTWPRLEVRVDSLDIVSRSLSRLPDNLAAQLPEDADNLMSLAHMRAGIHMLNLLEGRIDLYDVCVDGLNATLVQVDDERSNFNILPPSNAEPDTTATEIPDFSIDRFRLINTGPLKYLSLSDSVAVTLHLHDIDVSGTEAPHYALSVTTDIASPMAKAYNIDNINIAFDGRLTWDKNEPSVIAVDDLTLAVGADDALSVTFDGALRVAGDIALERWHLSAPSLEVGRLCSLLPEEMSGYVKGLDTNMSVTLDARSTAPYIIGDTIAIPDMHVSIDIPACRLRYGDMRVSRLEFNAEADIKGDNLDATKLSVNRLLWQGNTIDVSLAGKFSSLLSDPRIDATVMGRVRLDKLPRILTRQLPCELAGTVGMRSRLRMRMSQLTPKRFHRIGVDGTISLRDFNMTMRDSSMTAFVNEAMLKFGSNSHIETEVMRVDSLLTVSLSVDTLHLDNEGMTVAVRNLQAGLGSLNRSSSSDTTNINPFGGRISLDRLRVRSDVDSIRLNLRELECRGALRRFEGDGHNPRIDLDVKARRLMVSDFINRISLTRPEFRLSANIKPKKQMSARQLAIVDSIAAAHPDISRDSVMVLYAERRATRRAKRQQERAEAARAAREAGEEILEFEVDSGLKALLTRWDIHGHLSAQKGRITTPYIPLKNRLEHLDFDFTTDSVSLKELYLKSGQSDFTLSGTISEIRRNLTGRGQNHPLKIELSVKSDTINVNELTRALFAGSAMANDSTLVARNDADDDVDIDYEMNDTDEMAALIVPRNIDASLDVHAGKVLYSDLLFDDFTGQVLAYDGAINLRQLAATTDAGSVDLSALYSAPDPSDIKLGMGMRVHNFKLDRLTVMIPAIDSLMPMMRNFSGNVNADLALTTDIAPDMNLDISKLTALLKIEGDSLVLMDPETFRIASKWLFFKNKERNMIDHLSAEISVENSMLSLYPFMFNIDRYTLGVMGRNDLDLNLDYHVSIIKSPIPFKFGINITGTADDMKFRLGGAKIKENMVIERVQIADTVRVNLIDQFEKAFRRGVNAARTGRLTIDEKMPEGVLDGTVTSGTKPEEPATDEPANTLDMLRQALNSIPPDSFGKK